MGLLGCLFFGFVKREVLPDGFSKDELQVAPFSLRKGFDGFVFRHADFDCLHHVQIVSKSGNECQ